MRIPADISHVINGPIITASSQSVNSKLSEQPMRVDKDDDRVQFIFCIPIHAGSEKIIGACE